jgi:ATP-dependent helicase/nuclease subunit A
MSAGFKWKQDQLEALLAEGDLVLTASAGTGKTTILVAKFIRELFQLLLKAEPQTLSSIGGSPLNRMVAITFTELAAAQLKREIRLKLSSAIFGDVEETQKVFPEEGGTTSLPEYLRDYLARLIRELDGAYIGTIHSFCSRLLRENFIEAGLSPSFGILAEDDIRGRSKEVKLDAATEALDELLVSDDYLRALAVRIGYGALRKELIRLLDKLRTDGYGYIDPASIMATVRIKQVGAAQKAIKPLGKLLKQMSAELRTLSVSDLTEKNRPKAEQLSDVLSKAEPFCESEESLLSVEASDILAGLRKTYLLTGKAPANVNQLQKAYQELYDKGIPGECPPLCTVAGLAGDEANILSLIRAVKLYSEKYESKKEALDLLDYSDLLIRTRDLLRDNQQVRERYHRQFTHIFVDEFQDVDPLQNEIINLLHKPGKGRALVVVGDGKQSIYRFRGADVLSFREIASKVTNTGGQQLPLKTNFRSNPALIDSFNGLFGHLFEKERKTNPFQMEPADMTAFHEHKQVHPVVEWIRLKEHDPSLEGLAIVKAILRLTDGTALNRKGKPLSFGDITILLTTYSHLTVYEDALRRHSIPYAVEGGKGFYRQREVWDIIAYLKLLWFPDDDYALAAVLRSPLCLLSDESLLRLAQKNALNGRQLFKGDPPVKLPDDEADRFNTLTELVSRHRRLLDRIGTAEIIEELLEKTGYEAVLLARAGGDQSTANVRKLIEMARDYESSRIDSGLGFVLDAAGRMFTREMDDEPQAKLGAAAEGSVRILTIHKSKGLDFQAVIIPQLRYPGNRPNNPFLYDRHAGFGVKAVDPKTGEMSKSPSWKAVSASIEEQQEAEHLRLLYVAMTRAKERVILIGGSEKPQRTYVKPWEQRFEEMKEVPGLFEKIGVPELDMEELERIERKATSLVDLNPGIQSLQPVQIAEPAGSAEAERIVSRTIIRVARKHRLFSCSVRSMMELLSGGESPSADEYEAPDAEDPDEVDIETNGIPQARPVDIGKAVHSLLESIDLTHPPAMDEIANRLRQYGLDRGADKAADVVAKWLAGEDARAIAGLETQREVPFTAVLQEGSAKLHLSGAIDMLASLEGGGHWILDFKYAEADSNDIYRKQLLLYALALRRIPDLRPERLSLVWLKTQTLEDIPFDEASLDELNKVIFARLAQE